MILNYSLSNVQIFTKDTLLLVFRLGSWSESAGQALNVSPKVNFYNAFSVLTKNLCRHSSLVPRPDIKSDLEVLPTRMASFQTYTPSTV